MCGDEDDCFRPLSGIKVFEQLHFNKLLSVPSFPSPLGDQGIWTNLEDAYRTMKRNLFPSPLGDQGIWTPQYTDKPTHYLKFPSPLGDQGIWTPWKQ